MAARQSRPGHRDAISNNDVRLPSTSRAATVSKHRRILHQTFSVPIPRDPDRHTLVHATLPLAPSPTIKHTGVKLPPLKLVPQAHHPSDDQRSATVPRRLATIASVPDAIKPRCVQQRTNEVEHEVDVGLVSCTLPMPEELLPLDDAPIYVRKHLERVYAARNHRSD